MFREVVALGGEKALELRARDRLGGILEQLAVAARPDLDEGLELGRGEGVVSQNEESSAFRAWRP